MKHKLLLVFLLAICVKANAQTLDLNSPLPQDNSIRKGVLKNGMTYYLHPTDVTKNVASYYIIQNVGSILENDNQQGLAHFLEHMAFNGTESFPGKAFLNKLQENGLVFGKDINAYTSFDETVYNIDDVPTTQDLTDTALQILYDWSNYLLLTDAEIDAERGVIKEEWRTRQNGGMRILQNTIGTKYGNSKYANRLPIGQMDVVENFKYKALRDFYHDWYRTDLQAIAIIGDFDVDKMETTIVAKFSSIPGVQNPPKRFVVKIEDNDSLAYTIAMDKEISTSRISFGIRHDKSLENETIFNFKEDLLNSMLVGILNTRFTELTQDPDAPFIRIGVNYGKLSRLHKSFGIQIIPKPNMQQESFKLAMTELNRAVKFGFTNSEIKRIIAVYNSSYENQIVKIDDRSHKRIIRGIQSNYLENSNLSDLAKEYELAKVFFNEITNSDLLNSLQNIYTKKNRSVVVTGVDGNNNLTEAQTKEIIATAENNTSLQPYDEEKEVLTLMTGVTLTSGSIVSEKKNEDLGFTTYTLSNGIHVHYKFVDKNKNTVTLQAISDGGKSLIKNEDIPSVEIVFGVAQSSGLGAFSATELPKVLTGKTASTNLNIGSLTESVSGSSSTQDVETMLQLVNLRFTNPRLDTTGYDLLMQNIDNYVIGKSQDLKAKMNDSIITTLYGNNHPTKRLFNEEFVAEMSLDKVKSIYHDRFSDASDFTFFIVGDVSENNIEPLLAKYIASLPATNVKENWKYNLAEWSQKNTDKDIYLSMQDAKSTINIAVKKDMPFNLKDQFLMKTLGSILKLRYTESLREQEGGTYGASVSGYLIKEPKSRAYISVKFDCNPELAEKLIAIVYKEMDNIKNGIVLQEDLDKTTTNFLKERKDSKNFNGYDMAAIKNYVLEGYNIELPENFEDIINSITTKDIQDIANRVLTDYKSFEIVFKPLNQ